MCCFTGALDSVEIDTRSFVPEFIFRVLLLSPYTAHAQYAHACALWSNGRVMVLAIAFQK
jgi:hypothetical protein